MDDQWHRTPVQGARSKTNKSGSYRGHLDHIPAGYINNYKTGEEIWWKASAPTKALTPQEREVHGQQIEQQRIKGERERVARHIEVSKWAQKKWASTPEAPEDHLYLQRKGVAPHGLHLDVASDMVLVPMCDVEGKLWSIQTIDKDGDKHFTKDGRKQGTHTALGQLDPSKPLVIAEGFATAATAHVLTNLPTIAAFDSGNLLPVANSFRAKYPELQIIFAADNDHHLPLKLAGTGKPMMNVGIMKAQAAAEAVGGIVVWPDPVFDKEQDRGTDWNDYASVYGIDQGRRHFFERLSQSLVEREATLDKHLVEGKVKRIPPKSVGLHDQRLELERNQRQHGDENMSANDLARKFISAHHLLTTEDKRAYEYTGICWRPMSDAAFTSEVLQYDPSSSSRKRIEAYKFMLDDRLVRNESLRWNNLELYEVPFANGVLDLRADNANAMRAHRPEDYLDSVTPHDYEPTARCPNWFESLDLYFGDDPERIPKIKALQEYFGYCLTRHVHYKKALMLHGPGDSGKSGILNALTIMLGGSDRISQVKVADMDNPRSLAPIVDKLANIDADISESTVLKDGGFKKLVAGDPVLIDPKNVTPFTYVSTAKHILAGNELPSIKDKTEATFNRFLYIHLFRKIDPEKQDHTYRDRLETEALGLVAWAVEGAKRLYQQRGRFTVVRSAAGVIENYRETENPLLEKVRDFLVHEPKALISRDEFRELVNQKQSSKDWYSDSKLSRGLNAQGIKVRLKYYKPVGDTVRCLIDYRRKTREEAFMERLQAGDDMEIEEVNTKQ